jgi:hypothetical protein
MAARQEGQFGNSLSPNARYKGTEWCHNMGGQLRSQEDISICIEPGGEEVTADSTAS